MTWIDHLTPSFPPTHLQNNLGECLLSMGLREQRRGKNLLIFGHYPRGGGGPTRIQIVRGTFFLLWFGHFLGGGGPQSKHFWGTYLLKLGHYEEEENCTFFGQKRVPHRCPKKTGGGVKAILTMSKYEQIFSSSSFPNLSCQNQNTAFFLKVHIA